jgi:hypothetical protein
MGDHISEKTKYTACGVGGMAGKCELSVFSLSVHRIGAQGLSLISGKEE